MNAGERGVELASFVVDEIKSMSSEVERDIMTRRVLRAMEAARLYKPPKTVLTAVPVEPMSDSQAKAFSSAHMPFGQFRDVPISEVPRWYLCLFGDPSAWKDDLRRYLVSDRGQ